MRSFVVLMGVVGMMMVMGCGTIKEATTQSPALPLTSGKPFPIQRVSAVPKQVNILQNEKVVFQWEGPKNSDHTVQIFNEGGNLIRSLKGKGNSRGKYRMEWDGTNEEKSKVSSGVYGYVIRSQVSKGKEFVYDPSKEAGGEELHPTQITFDKASQGIQMIMPQAGRIRVRIGLRGFPHLRTLVDWEPLPGGRQTVPWNGLDASGSMRLFEHPDLTIHVAAYAFPDNTVIIQGISETVSHRKGDGIASDPGAYFHARHPRESCHEVGLEVSFPGATFTEEGLPLVVQRTPIRIQLEGTDKVSLVNERYEIALFVDTVFLFEEEEGTDPFTFYWDTTGLTPGEHLLTVNILGYEDHFGVRTLHVIKGATDGS